MGKTIIIFLSRTNPRLPRTPQPLTLAQKGWIEDGFAEQKFFVSDDGKEKLSITKAELQAGIDWEVRRKDAGLDRHEQVFVRSILGKSWDFDRA